MLASPSPTQQRPERDLKPEEKKVKSTPARKRTGQTPLAQFIKAIFRPIFKGVYFLLRAIRDHKLITLILIIVLLGSSTLATYLTTGALPFGIGSDPFHAFNIHGNGSSDHEKNWLYDLRDGNTTAMTLIESELIMSQPPDPTQLVQQFSQPKAHLTWKAINVIGVYTEADTTVESFVEVDLSANGPGGSVDGILIWHFTTLPQDQGRLLFIDLVSFRKPIQ